MIDLDYPQVLKLFEEHLAPKRNESASFLIWYLQDYYRLDASEAVDSVCDQRGDKGVDGIFVNDNDQTITIFQSRLSQNPKSTIGDVSLKEFVGTIGQFDSAEKIEHLIRTAGHAEVAALSKRLNLVDKIATHDLRGEFLVNVDLDANGESYLKTVPHVSFVGKTALATTHISDERELAVHGPITFDIVGYPVSQYVVDANIKAIIAPLKARELVKLEGIADQSIFAYNVRGPLGRTQVNKDIAKSLRDQSTHKMFPLFHNGITVIATELEANDAELTAGDYFVVNGCQSLNTLFSNQSVLTDDLRVLVKFIKMDPRSAWAADITRFSNNQNGVKPRDFKANHERQIRLQNEMAEKFPSQYVFDIKRGEILPDNATAISNEVAGLLLMAFDLKEPWATHRKYEVFEDKHSHLFGRPEVTADRIVLLQVAAEAIKLRIPEINNAKFAKYVLTGYLLLYVLREVLENDELAKDVLTTPEKFVRDKGEREIFRSCVGSLIGDIIVDLNGEVDELGDSFDYRDKLRDADWVKKISRKIVSDHLIRVKRGRIPSFKEEWETKHDPK